MTVSGHGVIKASEQMTRRCFETQAKLMDTAGYFFPSDLVNIRGKVEELVEEEEGKEGEGEKRKEEEENKDGRGGGGGRE